MMVYTPKGHKLRSFNGHEHIKSGEHPLFETKRDKKGFTLMEVMVAMIILAISLVVIFQLFSGGLRANRLSDAYTRGVFHAREKMDELLIADEFVCGLADGDFEDGYTWKAEILCPDAEEKEEGKKNILPVELVTIKVNVSWQEGRRLKHIELSTIKIGKLIEGES